MSVYLAGAIAPDQAAQVEDQLEALLLAPSLENRRLDLGAKLAEGRHEKGFQAVDGGSLWGVGRESTKADAPADASSAGPDEVTLPASVAHGLNAVNLLQQQYDREVDEIISMRRQLFADWYKSMICASSRRRPGGLPRPGRGPSFHRDEGPRAAPPGRRCGRQVGGERRYFRPAECVLDA